MITWTVPRSRDLKTAKFYLRLGKQKLPLMQGYAVCFTPLNDLPNSLDMGRKVSSIDLDVLNHLLNIIHSCQGLVTTAIVLVAG